MSPRRGAYSRASSPRPRCHSEPCRLNGPWNKGGAVLMLQPSLTHFVKSLREARARWSPGDELDRVLEQVSGDIVQAIQALKESRTETTSALFDELYRLLTSFESLSGYCSSAVPKALGYPFIRAERQVRDALSFLYPETAASLSSSEAAKIISISATKRRVVDIETFQLGPHHMPRVFNGFWQLSSSAWGSASAESQEAALAELIELGLSTAGEWTSTLWFPFWYTPATRTALRAPRGHRCRVVLHGQKSGHVLLTEPFLQRHGRSLRRRRADLWEFPEQATK